MPGEIETTVATRRRHCTSRWAFMENISRSSLKKVKTKTEGSRRHWGAFCRSTSIHGMRYLAEPSRSWFERLWWLAVVFFGFLTATYYVSRQFVKWSQTSIEANNLMEREDIRDIPFPAFTICDNRKMAFPINMTVDELDQNLLYMICGDDRITDSNYTIDDYIKWSSTFILDCQLLTDDEDKITTDCKSMFVRTLTDQGICYTFNMLDPKEIFKDKVSTSHEHHGRSTDWKLETGYFSEAPLVDKDGTKSLDSGPFPKRGKHLVYLNIYHANDTIPGYCSGTSDGFKFTLHSPHEMPTVGLRQSPWIPLQGETSGKYIDIPAHGNILIDVRASKIVAGDELKIYNARQRKCYFPGELELAYFRTYSNSNCHLECLTNITIKLCNCKDIYMPTWDHDINTSKICAGNYYMKCIHYAYDFWDKNRHECECLPTCTTLQYNSKIWLNRRPMHNEREEEGMKKTKIVFYSTDRNYVKSERRAVYCLVDFIADCGGVFGLFCGMSIISFLELIYYSILWLLNKKKAVHLPKNN